MLYSLHFFHFCLEHITSKNEVKVVGLDQISYIYERMSFDKVALFQDGDSENLQHCQYKYHPEHDMR